MKKLTLEETRLKEEMKERCLAKGQYIDENAKAKFEMLCHLEDFEVKYWELQQENQQLKERIEYLERSNNRREDTILEQQQKISDLEDNWNKLKEYANKMHEYFLYTDVNEIYKQSMKEDNLFPNLFNLSELNASDRILSSICKKIQELEQGSDSNVED